MKRSKRSVASQPMSPEAYIRTKSRALPIYQCLINTDWDSSGLSSIVLARRHSNGNVTACIYLVDLYCQGVKDTFWYFNMPESGYNDLVEEIRNKQETIKVDYVLIHNIIYAALEFAEEYDFLPHRDFSSVTSHMLEEDTDEIDLMDIECGMNGKPAYVRTPEHSRSETQRIISKLERNPGPGNYYFLDQE